MRIPFTSALSAPLASPSLARPGLTRIDAFERVAATGVAQTPPPAGLSLDFRTWLATSPYAAYDFARTDVPGGSFGGRMSPSDQLTGRPIVFVHGNSDSALGRPHHRIWTGWQKSLAYFAARGCRPQDLYGTTWGDANPLKTALATHSKSNVMQVRKFLEAVLAYTGSQQIDVITHSMGVTLARKAIRGGPATDDDGTEYDVGPPLSERVRTFVGIAGANRGLASGFTPLALVTPTISTNNGLFPGAWTPFGTIMKSPYLADLETEPGSEGERCYAVWSRRDQVMPASGLVWGEPTARIPGQTGEFVSGRLGHFGLKDKTAELQYRLVRGS